MINENVLSEVVPFYSKLSPSERELLVAGVQERTFKKGERVHTNGDACAGVLLVERGRLRAYMMSDEGREVTLYFIDEGDACVSTASCVMRSLSFGVFIDADEDVRAYQIPASLFAKLVDKNIYVENFALNAAAERFSDVMYAIQQLLFVSFEKRLAMFLYDESIRSDDGTVRLTHEQIARRLGSAREVVTRMLQQFVKEGFVSLNRGAIEVTDRRALRKVFSD